MAGVHLFGVRHLSPAAGHNVVRFLDALQPEAVLIEGPHDMTACISDIVSEVAKPPIGVLAYTLKPPVESVLYPLAVYSPEYQAMKWAHAHGVPAACIDLPSASVLAFAIAERERLLARAEQEEGEKAPAPCQRRDIYSQLAARSGELTHEDWWERNFECLQGGEQYRRALLRYGEEIRAGDDSDRYDAAYNAVREAHMKRRIQETVESGAKTVAVVCGAFHAPALSDWQEGGMTDEELAALPRAQSSLTLMPYAYSRLSSRSGYGAGNKAPAYFEMLFHELERGDVSDHAAHYMTALAGRIREGGGVKSSAEVIDAVRLAEALSALKGGSVPILRDLRDAAASILGAGSFAPLAEAAAQVEIGSAIGSLPEGVTRTSVQEDFYRCLRELKLTRYQTQIAAELDLDIRENNRSKSVESAFLDLNRSRFLHRLRLAGVSFARWAGVQASAWAEKWTLQWTPESEIELVETSLLGDTVEAAAAYAVKSKLEACASVAEAAALVDSCVLAGLTDSLREAASCLQGLSVAAASFSEIADTVATLSRIRRYGSLRRTDTESLLPLLSRLFYRGTLLLSDAANCDNAAADPMLESVLQMETAAQNHFEEVDEDSWLTELNRLAERDDRNPLLSGYACAVLVDRGLVDAQHLSAMVCRRLSQGTPADIGAAWFEGLSRKNRYSLIARQSLWSSLDGYVGGLDDEEFKRAVVFLRRAFAEYSPQEKVRICENLSACWGVNADSAVDALSREMSESEAEELAGALEEFDFGDL